MASQNFHIQQFQLFHDPSQAWMANIDTQQIECVGLALLDDGTVQGLVSATQVSNLTKSNTQTPQQGWIPASMVDGFKGYDYQPRYSATGETMRESVSSGASSRSPTSA